MISGRAVVVGYDGSPASAAAARWAATEAEVEAFRCGSCTYPPGPFFGPPQQRRLRIDIDVVVGETVPVLLREATAAAVLVLGSRGLGEFRDLAAGSVMTHLATHATCPVVVVPAGWRAEPAGDLETTRPSR